MEDDNVAMRSVLKGALFDLLTIKKANEGKTVVGLDGFIKKYEAVMEEKDMLYVKEKFASL